MKTIKAVLILFAAGHALSAQNIEMESNLVMSQPVGAMARNMNNAFGLTIAASKHFKAPFSAGVELNFGNYGNITSRQQYTFDDGSVTETDVNVGNNLFSLYLTGKHFLRENKNINPYLSGKLAGPGLIPTSRLKIRLTNSVVIHLNQILFQETIPTP